MEEWDGNEAAAMRAAAVATEATLLQALSQHWSGHVRERALRRCAELARPELLALFCARLNDWVPRVRDLARAGMLSLAPAMPASVLMDTLPTLVQLRAARRSDHSHFIAAYEALVLMHAGCKALLAGVHEGGSARARACLALAQHGGCLDAAALAYVLAGKGPDIILALHAVALCARMPSSEHPSLYRAGLLSSFGAVRTIALRALLDLGPDDHAAIARAALADPQSSVRSLAIAHLAATGEHPAVLYRQLLANRGDTADQGARRIRIALTGLASMRERSDLALFRQFSSHPVGAVRLAALAGWLRVAEEDKDAVAAQALADPVAGVRKLALYAVRRRGAYLNFDLVRNSLEACGDLVLLLNFARASRWNWIECIVRAALRRPWDAPLTTMLAAALRHWLDSRSDQYSVPSPGQRVFLDEPYVLATLARLLNERTDLQLRLAQALQR